MKLIIEIPDMAYEAYKEWHKNKVATVEQSLIANGTPYNPTVEYPFYQEAYQTGYEEGKNERPQGDLISREALKENGTVIGMVNGQKMKVVPLSAIDNAPTIEPFEPDYVGAERVKARQRGYAEGYHNGMEIGKTLNPKIKQGETNAEIFKQTFGIYATEIWSMKEADFLEWLNADMREEAST